MQNSILRYIKCRPIALRNMLLVLLIVLFIPLVHAQPIALEERWNRIKLMQFESIEENEKAIIEYIGLCEKAGNAKGMVLGFNELGKKYTINKDNVKALENLKRGLQLAKDENYKGLEGVVLNSIAVLSFINGNYEDGTAQALNALELLIEVQDSVTISIVCSNLSHFNKQHGRYDKAKVYLRKGLSYIDKEESPWKYMLAANNLAEIYALEHKHDSAEAVLKGTMELFYFPPKGIQSYYTMATTYQLVSKLYIEKQEFKEALYYIEKARAICERHHLNLFMIQVYIDNALINLNIGKAAKVADQMTVIERLVDSIGSIDERLQLSELKFKYYATVGELDSVNHYYNHLQTLEDSLQSLAMAKATHELEIQYDLKNTNEKLETLAQVNITQKRNNLYLILLVVILIVLSMVLILFFHQRNVLTKQKEIAFSNEKMLLEHRNTLLIREKEIDSLQQEKLLNEIEIKKREQASAHMLNLEKGKMLNDLAKQLSELKKKTVSAGLSAPEILSMEKLLEIEENSAEHWENFKLHFDQVNPQFFENLKLKFDKLTPNDLKQCAYIKLNLSVKEVARITGISAKSVQQSRYRIKKKMNLNESTQIHEVL